MKCPKCNKEMAIDDRDSDYKAYNNLPVLVDRTTWWICDNCGCSATAEAHINYFDVNGANLELDEYVENEE